MALVRSAATVGGFTMLSRVLGFARDILVAAFLGAGTQADAFFVAFKFPNLFRRLFAEGAFAAAFVPLFAGRLETEGREAAAAFAREAMAGLAFALLLFVALVEIAMPWAMALFAPGFLAQPDKFDLTVDLTRITFPYLLLVSLVSLAAGVLNALGRFSAAAAAPALLNLVMIGALVGLSPLTPTPAHALAWGVAAAGVVQLAFLLAACRRAGLPLRLVRPRFTPAVRLLLRRILPVALGAGLYQLNLLVDTVLASLLPEGSVSFLYYADRVNQLPLGVVGVAVGTALLPLLARQIKAGSVEVALHNQNRAVELSLLLTLPAAAALVVLADPIVDVLFRRGAFGPGEAAATAAALRAFALGIPGYVLVKALTPGFFAREDTATPVKVAAVCLGVTVVLNVALMIPFKHVGIALATAITAWVNAGLLGLLLRRRGHFALDARLKARLPRILAATLAMAAAVGLARWGAGAWLDGPLGLRAAGLALLIALGLGVFGLAAQATGAATLAEVRKALGRKAA